MRKEELFENMSPEEYARRHSPAPIVDQGKAATRRSELRGDDVAESNRVQNVNTVSKDTDELRNDALHIDPTTGANRMSKHQVALSTQGRASSSRLPEREFPKPIIGAGIMDKPMKSGKNVYSDSKNPNPLRWQDRDYSLTAEALGPDYKKNADHKQPTFKPSRKPKSVK